MPARITPAPAAWDSSIISARLLRITAIGRPAQAVVATELDDHDGRLMQLEGPGQALQPPRGGVARDAGIHHAIAVTFGLQPLAEQRNPGFLLGNAECGTEAVTHHEHGLAPLGSAAS